MENFSRSMVAAMEEFAIDPDYERAVKVNYLVTDGQKRVMEREEKQAKYNEIISKR